MASHKDTAEDPIRPGQKRVRVIDTDSSDEDGLPEQKGLAPMDSDSSDDEIRPGERRIGVIESSSSSEEDRPPLLPRRYGDYLDALYEDMPRREGLF